MIDNIPNDVLLEIILRLDDCQSVMICTSVSKRWLSLITENSILKRRFNLRFPEICTQLIGIRAANSLFHRYYELRSLEKASKLVPETAFLDFLPWSREEDVRIRGSAGDLLLVSRRNEHIENSYERDFLVCNPSTKQVVTLPRSPLNCATRWSLVLESKSCGTRGGCNCNIRFRAILFSFPAIYEDQCVATVFCSDTGQWDEAKFRCPVKSEGLTIMPVNNNNVLHWLSGDRYIVTYNPFRRPGGRLGSVGLPYDYKSAPAEDLLLGSVGGRLRLAQTVREDVEGRPRRQLLRVWERNLCESWVLEHEAEVELGAAYVFAFNEFERERVFMVGVEEEEEDILVYDYNIKESNFRQLGRLPASKINYQPWSADYCTLFHPPTPTFIPPLPTAPDSLLTTLLKLLLPWLRKLHIC